MYVVCSICGDKANSTENAVAFDYWIASMKEQTVKSLFLERSRWGYGCRFPEEVCCVPECSQNKRRSHLRPLGE